MFDLNILFAYNDINKLAQGISNLARVCNPDRFGAKQTIFATNKVFRDIETIVNGDNAKQHSVLNVEDKMVILSHFLKLFILDLSLIIMELNLMIYIII